MKDALDVVAWSELEHNYGWAADIPQHLLRGTHQDPDVAAGALFELHNLLFHQGGWVCSAAPAAAARHGLELPFGYGP